MTAVRIEQLTRSRLISAGIASKIPEDEVIQFNKCISATSIIMGGFGDGKLVCVWGLVPPTIMSNSAYLWLQVLAPIEPYQFVFVRHSQRAIEMALEKYPVIVGHCRVGAETSMRWLRWLGARFAEPDGMLVPFIIKRKKKHD